MFLWGFFKENKIELVFQDQLFEYFSEIIYLGKMGCRNLIDRLLGLNV